MSDRKTKHPSEINYDKKCLDVLQSHQLTKASGEHTKSETKVRKMVRFLEVQMDDSNVEVPLHYFLENVFSISRRYICQHHERECHYLITARQKHLTGGIEPSGLSLTRSECFSSTLLKETLLI